MTNNILELCLSPDLGGLELYMSNCAKSLDLDFKITSVISKNSKLEAYYKNTDYSYETLKRNSSFSLITSLKLAKIIDKYNIDLIHIHWTKDIPIVVLAKLFSKQKPKIIQTRHMTMTRFKDDFYHKFLYKHIDYMIAVTKEVSNQLHKFIPLNISPKIEVLYLGANCPNKYTQKEIINYKKELKINNSFSLGLIGRINEFKGQCLLIEAMKVLKSKNHDIKAYIVGHAMQASYLNTLKEKVKEYNLEEEVIFLGFLNEPHKFMQACDSVLMTSKNETFGLVTIEAMQMGTAVIGSNSGGVLEIIDDKKTGLLFETQNVDDLVLKIETLYLNPKLKEELAFNGEIKANEMFNNTKQFNKLIELFKKI